jgi:hypothetical protein
VDVILCCLPISLKTRSRFSIILLQVKVDLRGCGSTRRRFMCLSNSFRFDLEHYQDHGDPGLTPHAVRTVQTTWLQLTAAELLGVRTTSELTGRVEERYGLSHEQATRDVEFWSLGKQL